MKGFRGRQRRGFWRDTVLLVVLMIVGLVLRLLFAQEVKVVPPDGASYGILARTFLQEGPWESFHVYWSPLYPTAVGVVGGLFGDLEKAGQFVSVVFGAALLIPAYYLARRFYGRRTAAISAGLVVFYPFLIERSTIMATESLYTFLFCCLLLVGWRALAGNHVGLYAGSGVLIGLLYLTRTEAFMFVFLYACFGVVRLVSARTWGHGARTLVGQIVLVGCFLGVASPYLVFIHEQTGLWSPGLRGLNLVTSWKTAAAVDKRKRVNASGDVLENQIVASGRLDRQWQPPQRDIDVAWFVGESAKRLYKVYRTYQPILLPGFVVVFVSLGLFGRRWSKTRAVRESYLLVIVLSVTLGYSISYVKERFFTCLLPIFLLWAGQGVLFFGRWMKQSVSCPQFSQRALARMGIMAALALLLLSFMPKYVKFVRKGQGFVQGTEHKKAGLWIKANMEPGQVVMSARPYVAFYGNGKHLYIPEAEYPEILAYAVKKGTDLLVIDQEFVPIDHPSLTFLLSEAKPSASLVAVYANGGEGQKVVLYKVNKSSN